MKKFLLVLVALLVLSSITINIILLLNKQKPVVYNTKIYDSNLSLNDFTIVACGNNFYIPKSFEIEKINSNKIIENISVQVFHKGNLIYDVFLQFPDSNIFKPASDVVVTDYKLRKEDTITFKIKYVIDDENIELYEDVKLSKNIKQ